MCDLGEVGTRLFDEAWEFPSLTDTQELDQQSVNQVCNIELGVNELAKIQCPHCKAMNQDMTLDDPCWQCGTVLGAPASSLETGAGAPTSEANAANTGGSSNAAVQTQIERERPSGAVPSADRPRGTLTANVIAIAVIVIAALLILVVVMMKFRH